MDQTKIKSSFNSKLQGKTPFTGLQTQQFEEKGVFALSTAPKEYFSNFLGKF